MDQLVLLSIIGEPEAEANISTDQLVPLSINESEKKANEDIHLFRYFIKNVLWLIFPVVKVSQNHIARSIIDILESNPCYLRSCLNIAAIYLKYTEELEGLTKANIIWHCHAATLEYYKAVGDGRQLLLKAILSTIFIWCSDDFPSDIPWHHHLEIGVLLVKELKLPLQYSLMSLIVWVDILEAIMVLQSPIFAHVYHEMREAGLAIGLLQLIRCNNSIMYVIVKTIYLKKLKASGAIEHI